MSNLLIKYIPLLIILLSLIGIYFSYETVDIDLNVEKELKEVATKAYLEERILNARNTEQFNDFDTYINLSKYLKINFDNETNLVIKKQNNFMNKTLRNTKEFSTSFITGESSSSIGMVGSITSDMFVIGDLRDLTIEGTKFVNGEDYDELILGMSALGVGSTVSQIVTIGSTTSVKVGVSIIKFSKKIGTLSEPFLDSVLSKIRNSMNFSLFREVDFSSIVSIKDGFQSFSKSIDFSKTNELLNNINILNKNTSLIDSVELLKFVDNDKDLSRLVKISEKYTNNTKGVMKVLGKRALKSTKTVIKYTTKLIVELISLIISSILFLFSFLSKVSFFKSLRLKKG